MCPMYTDLQCSCEEFFSKEENNSAQYSGVQYRLFGIKVWMLPQNVEKIDCLIKLAYRMNYFGIPF